jgi:type VI protein secretion system component VasA
VNDVVARWVGLALWVCGVELLTAARSGPSLAMAAVAPAGGAALWGKGGALPRGSALLLAGLQALVSVSAFASYASRGGDPVQLARALLCAVAAVALALAAAPAGGPRPEPGGAPRR